MRIERSSSGGVGDCVACRVECQWNGWEFRVVVSKSVSVRKFQGAWDVEVWPRVQPGDFPTVRRREGNALAGLSRIVFGDIRHALVAEGCPEWLADHLAFCSRDALTNAVLEREMERQAARAEAQVKSAVSGGAQ